MFIVFLRFGTNRGEAPRWMAGHRQWLQQGLDDRVFLLAGSWDGGLAQGTQGGAVLATGLDRASLIARVEQDPFVVHGVVDAEVHGLSASLVAPALATLLAGGRPATSA